MAPGPLLTMGQIGLVLISMMVRKREGHARQAESLQPVDDEEIVIEKIVFLFQ